MDKVTIYRFSKNPRYEDTYENNSWFEVNKQVDDDEFYLFREVWELDDVGYYQSMIDNDFVKVVNKKWIKDHTLYYGCRILNDAEYGTDDITDYAMEIQNML